MAQVEDKVILELFKDEKTRNTALTHLIAKYQKMLYWHIRKIVIDHDDSDDVLQNTFIKVWKGLENFREESQLYTWMYRIATNESLTFLRQKKAHLYVKFDDVASGLSGTLQDDNYFNGDDLQKKLQEAILTLPDKQRVVFNLRYFDEMPYEQMSQVTETSVGALKASYHHAAKKIEEYMVKSVGQI